MLDFLKGQYENVKDWLKYAEAKNGILITLCIGFLLGITDQNIIEGWEKGQSIINWIAMISFGLQQTAMAMITR